MMISPIVFVALLAALIALPPLNRSLDVESALGLLLGANFLDYDVLAHDPQHGQHYGIILVELGVGITVAAVMMTVFFAFAGRAGGAWICSASTITGSSLS